MRRVSINHHGNRGSHASTQHSPQGVKSIHTFTITKVKNTTCTVTRATDGKDLPSVVTLRVTN